MKNKNTLKERVWELRKIELQKIAEVKRGLYAEGFWVPKKTQK
jgi:hypothetical protein